MEKWMESLGNTHANYASVLQAASLEAAEAK